MSESLEKLDVAGADLIDKVGTSAEKLLVFVEREAPQLMEELIVYGRTVETLEACLGIVMFLSGMWWAIKIWKLGWTLDWHDNSPDNAECIRCLIFGAVAGLGMMVGAVVFGPSVGSCIKTWVAPRVYLLEYFSDFVS